MNLHGVPQGVIEEKLANWMTWRWRFSVGPTKGIAGKTNRSRKCGGYKCERRVSYLGGSVNLSSATDAVGVSPTKLESATVTAGVRNRMPASYGILSAVAIPYHRYPFWKTMHYKEKKFL